MLDYWGKIYSECTPVAAQALCWRNQDHHVLSNISSPYEINKPMPERRTERDERAKKKRIQLSEAPRPKKLYSHTPNDKEKVQTFEKAWYSDSTRSGSRKSLSFIMN